MRIRQTKQCDCQTLAHGQASDDATQEEEQQVTQEKLTSTTATQDDGKEVKKYVRVGIFFYILSFEFLVRMREIPFLSQIRTLSRCIKLWMGMKTLRVLLW